MKKFVFSVFIIIVFLNSAIAAIQSQQSSSDKSRIIGVCHIAESVQRPVEFGSGQNLISPEATVRAYFNTVEHHIVKGQSNVIVLQNPTHGTLADLGTFVMGGNNGKLIDSGEKNYLYQPEDEYVGQDSTILKVEIGGYNVKVIYFFHVFAEIVFNDIPYTQELCTNGYLWPISTQTNTDKIEKSKANSPTRRSSGTPRKRGAP